MKTLLTTGLLCATIGAAVAWVNAASEPVRWYSVITPMFSFDRACSGATFKRSRVLYDQRATLSAIHDTALAATRRHPHKHKKPGLDNESFN